MFYCSRSGCVLLQQKRLCSTAAEATVFYCSRSDCVLLQSKRSCRRRGRVRDGAPPRAAVPTAPAAGAASRLAAGGGGERLSAPLMEAEPRRNRAYREPSALPLGLPSMEATVVPSMEATGGIGAAAVVGDGGGAACRLAVGGRVKQSASAPPTLKPIRPPLGAHSPLGDVNKRGRWPAPLSTRGAGAGRRPAPLSATFRRDPPLGALDISDNVAAAVGDGVAVRRPPLQQCFLGPMYGPKKASPYDARCCRCADTGSHRSAPIEIAH